MKHCVINVILSAGFLFNQAHAEINFFENLPASASASASTSANTRASVSDKIQNRSCGSLGENLPINVNGNHPIQAKLPGAKLPGAKLSEAKLPRLVQSNLPVKSVDDSEFHDNFPIPVIGKYEQPKSEPDDSASHDSSHHDSSHHDSSHYDSDSYDSEWGDDFSNLTKSPKVRLLEEIQGGVMLRYVPKPQENFVFLGSTLQSIFKMDPYSKMDNDRILHRSKRGNFLDKTLLGVKLKRTFGAIDIENEKKRKGKQK